MEKIMICPKAEKCKMIKNLECCYPHREGDLCDCSYCGDENDTVCIPYYKDYNIYRIE